MRTHHPEPDWLLAECAGQTDLFFSEFLPDKRRAQKICFDCSIMHDCLAYAVNAKITYGVFGGVVASQRIEMFRALERTEKDQCSPIAV